MYPQLQQLWHVKQSLIVYQQTAAIVACQAIFDSIYATAAVAVAF
jgi:hypothetical protein